MYLSWLAAPSVQPLLKIPMRPARGSSSFAGVVIVNSTSVPSARAKGFAGLRMPLTNVSGLDSRDHGLHSRIVPWKSDMQYTG